MLERNKNNIFCRQLSFVTQDNWNLSAPQSFLNNFDLSSWQIILLNIHLVNVNNPLHFKTVSCYLQFSVQFVIELIISRRHAEVLLFFSKKGL